MKRAILIFTAIGVLLGAMFTAVPANASPLASGPYAFYNTSDNLFINGGTDGDQLTMSTPTDYNLISEGSDYFEITVNSLCAWSDGGNGDPVKMASCVSGDHNEEFHISNLDDIGALITQNSSGLYLAASGSKVVTQSSPTYQDWSVSPVA
jgi:hypothetical protein